MVLNVYLKIFKYLTYAADFILIILLILASVLSSESPINTAMASYFGSWTVLAWVLLTGIVILLIEAFTFFDRFYEKTTLRYCDQFTGESKEGDERAKSSLQLWQATFSLRTTGFIVSILFILAVFVMMLVLVVQVFVENGVLLTIQFYVVSVVLVVYFLFRMFFIKKRTS